MNYPITVNSSASLSVMNIYKDRTVEYTSLFLEPSMGNSGTSLQAKMCMISANSNNGVPTALTVDATFSCLGGTVGTANKENVMFSSVSLTIANCKYHSEWKSDSICWWKHEIQCGHIG